MAQRPKLSLKAQAEIEKAKDDLFLRTQGSWPMVFNQAPQFVGGRSPLPPKTPKPATFKLQLRDYATTAFDLEAQHYMGHTRDEAELRSWLQNLGACVAAEIGVDLTRFQDAHNYHCSAAERTHELLSVIQERIDELVKQACNKWLIGTLRLQPR